MDQKTKTGISVQSSDWSESKQRIKLSAKVENLDFLNDRLTKLEKYLFDQYNKDFSNFGQVSRTWLKESVNRFFNRAATNKTQKIYFVDFANEYLEQSKKRVINGEQIKQRSLNNYLSTISKLEAFEAHKKTKLRFEDIDLQFHGDFINYCKEIEKLNNNTIGSIISRIKTFCRNAEIEGFPINPKYKHRDFNMPKNETFETYLNEDEINKIFKHDFSKSQRLDNARDLFIIGLRTGLRISDILRITEENIIGNVINITTQKTRQNLTIPIHPQFQKILDKYNGGLPRKITEQKFNLYIKEVCEEVGINEPTPGFKFNKETKCREFKNHPKYDLIKSHSCRRSFATNLFLAGIDVTTIMAATGHKSAGQFYGYVKASQDEHIKKISEYWEKQTKSIKTDES